MMQLSKRFAEKIITYNCQQMSSGHPNSRGQDIWRAAGRSWINYWLKNNIVSIDGPSNVMSSLITDEFLLISSLQLLHCGKYEWIHIYVQHLSLVGLPNSHHTGECSPHGEVLISFWNQDDLFKMFLCKPLEEKLAVIWVWKQSVCFQDSHQDNPGLLHLNLFFGRIRFRHVHRYRAVRVQDTFRGKKSCVLCEHTVKQLRWDGHIHVPSSNNWKDLVCWCRCYRKSSHGRLQAVKICYYLSLCYCYCTHRIIVVL